MPAPSRWHELLAAPAFVINLDRRPERLEAACAELDAAGFTDVRRFVATDGENPEALAAAWEALGNPRFDPWDGAFPRSPGKQGCFLSHMRLWQHVVDEDLPFAVVFEDDIFFHLHFGAIAPTCFALTPQDYDLLYLGGAHYMRGPELVVRAPCFCLHAVVVTREGARSLHRAVLAHPTGVMTIDVLVVMIQRLVCAGRPWVPHCWYVWNGIALPDRRARAFDDWIDYNGGIVFQNRRFPTDLTTKPPNDTDVER